MTERWKWEKQRVDVKIASKEAGSSSTESELERHLRRASKIARLLLSEEELKGLLGDAEAIFGEFSKIQELDTRTFFEETPETGIEGALRDDDFPEKFQDADGILACVPKKEGRLVLAPKSL